MSTNIDLDIINVGIETNINGHYMYTLQKIYIYIHIWMDGCNYRCREIDILPGC